MSSEGKCPLNQLKGQVLALRKCRQLAISIILLTRQTTASCASPPHTDRRRGQKPSVSTSSVQVYNTINHLHLRSPELIWVIRMGPSFCIYKLNPAVTITLMFEEHTHTHTAAVTITLMFEEETQSGHTEVGPHTHTHTHSPTHSQLYCLYTFSINASKQSLLGG